MTGSNLGWLSGLLRRAATSILTIAPVPQHVAFIMDGNRRYAERHHLQTVQGHSFGYQRLIQALEWCLDLGITCVSVYAFSVDNYKRSEQEVFTLMRLAEEKFSYMMEEHAVLERHGVQVRVLGDLSLAPPAVQAAARRVMDATQSHNKAVLNICFSYTSSRELQQAMETSSISGNPLEEHLYTHGCPPVDLLIRTSGERRLSDFLLLQSSHALLVFTGVLWPDFGFFDLVSAIIQYQMKYPTLQAARLAAAEARGKRKKAAPTAAVLLEEEQAVPGSLPELKIPLSTDKADSPCGVATPGSGSSPSCRSEGSAEEHILESVEEAAELESIASPAIAVLSTDISLPRRRAFQQRRGNSIIEVQY